MRWLFNVNTFVWIVVLILLILHRSESTSNGNNIQTKGRSRREWHFSFAKILSNAFCQLRGRYLDKILTGTSPLPNAYLFAYAIFSVKISLLSYIRLVGQSHHSYVFKLVFESSALLLYSYHIHIHTGSNSISLIIYFLYFIIISYIILYIYIIISYILLYIFLFSSKSFAILLY